MLIHRCRPVLRNIGRAREERQDRYRGYDIKMQRRDLCWFVTLRPSRTDLPKFQRHSFKTATQSQREALSQARQRVDHVLSART
jgi:hypothetical protein